MHDKQDIKATHDMIEDQRNVAEDRWIDLFLRDIENGVPALTFEELLSLKPTTKFS